MTGTDNNLGENQRKGRAMDRSVIKRDTYAAQIRSIHQLAVKASEDSSASTQLSVAVRDLDTLWADLVIEDNTILDTMCELGTSEQYSGALLVELRDLITYAKAVAQHFEFQNGSVQGGSSCNRSVANQSQGTANVSTHNTAGMGDISHMTHSRLPEIPLPRFNGNVYKWPEFRDRFTALVDSKSHLTNIEKIYYLLGCLEGPASEAVRGIPVSTDTYRLMWSTLSTKFDKPRIVACSLVEGLLGAHGASHESLESLNKFMSSFSEGVSVLKSLNIPDLGDFILFVLASRCLPASSRTLFEANNYDEYPTSGALFEFVKSRIMVLKHAGYTRQNHIDNKSRAKGDELRKSHKHHHITSLVTSGSSSSTCKCCSGDHSLSSCTKFKSWSVPTRVKWVREHRICFLCLSDKHWANRCQSKGTCSKCSRRHHILIHEEQAGNQRKNSTLDTSDQNPGSSSSLCGRVDGHAVLLGTALVHIRDCAGSVHTVRALVDSASQISAITSSCVSRLGLRKSRWTAPITGLSGTPVAKVEGLVQCQVLPRFAEDPVIPLKAWVLPSITADMPRSSVSDEVSMKFEHLALADPTFAKPSPVDLLLGADIFAVILNGKRVEVGNALPVAFGSIFGWIIIGPIPLCNTVDTSPIPIVLTTSVESLLERFWQIEEPETAPLDFTEDGKCESIFRLGCTRNADGRYVVPLPFRKAVDPNVFRGSREVAIKRFGHLERKLEKDPSLREMYCTFMAEYIALGHMSPASSPGQYWIPHHAVYKPSDVIPKLRVVFDASATSFSGTSLNACLHTGPKLQQDVTDILLLFRLPRHAFTADVCKMYRQILVSPEFRPYQHVFWRASPLEELKEYELNTVTYEVSCAPYLAMRVLRSVADTDGSNFPAVRDALLTRTYVDDICCGADNEEAVLQLQSDLIMVLDKAGFQLKKWSSNNKNVLNKVLPEDRACDMSSFDDHETGVKVLGLRWDHYDDFFSYTVQTDVVVTTKRGMLSLIARVFDPLGLLAPTIFLAKHIMQQVWLSNLSWDEKLPAELTECWLRYVNDLPILSQLRIPRFIGTEEKDRCVLCGFCDASERGYAAVVYLRLERANQPPSVFLLGTKTKLAPMKSATIPRLELCAAVLLAKWMHRIVITLDSKLDITHAFAWTDSSIVLNWLTVPHQSFKIFVSNRIHQVRQMLPGCQWRHVRSADNPADCASRGVFPEELKGCSLYWTGPAFLYSSIETWCTEVPVIPVELLPEFKSVAPVVLVSHEEIEWFTRFSSLSHMLRVVAWMQRFIKGCQRKSETTNINILSRKELDMATLVIVRTAQAISFQQLRQELATQSPVTSRVLARLRPFISEKDIICVGGRLSHSDLPRDQRFPILLAKSSHLSWLLVSHWHKATCHSGPRVITSVIGRHYWILSLRSLIRSVISRCTRCVRLAAVNPQPVMADLPRARVSECRPFSRVGIDFAGPLKMKDNKLRKSREYKVYVAVFICFVVKAVHLEVVSELSTPAFLAALNRFVARRGLPCDIYSDCGTNFVGAAKHLRALFNDIGTRDQVVSAIHSNWHFNPPSAPHFGGLWEAAVRSTKNLLTRVMGEHLFTFEEFTTLLCRVESVLNSRPLTPASTDPSDLECLTPGHFLIGQPLLTTPMSDADDSSPRDLRNRWKLLNQCFQSFWKR